MNNKDFDKILKPLRDYDPQVKPDWEAFVAAGGGELNNPTKTPGQTTGSLSKVAMMKYAAIFITIASGIFFLWNYNSNINSEATTEDALKTIKAIETPYIPAKVDANNELPQPRNSKNLLQDNSSPTKADLKYDNSAQPAPVDSDLSSLQSTEKSSAINTKPVIVKTTDTVLIKKTIIIRDTIHSQKPKLK